MFLILAKYICYLYVFIHKTYTKYMFLHARKIRRVAVREASVSLHHEGPIEGPSLKPFETLQHYGIEGFKGTALGQPMWVFTALTQMAFLINVCIIYIYICIYVLTYIFTHKTLKKTLLMKHYMNFFLLGNFNIFVRICFNFVKKMTSYVSKITEHTWPKKLNLFTFKWKSFSFWNELINNKTFPTYI